MRSRWIILVPLLLLACGRLPEGVGSNHEVMVLTDEGQWGRFAGILREIFERKVFTAQEENISPCGRAIHRNLTSSKNGKIW
jgi:hypothetical protein